MKTLALICLAVTVLEVAPVPCNNWRQGGGGQPSQANPRTDTVVVVLTPAAMPATNDGANVQGRRKRDVRPPPPHPEEHGGKGGHREDARLSGDSMKAEFKDKGDFGIVKHAKSAGLSAGVSSSKGSKGQGVSVRADIGGGAGLNGLGEKAGLEANKGVKGLEHKSADVYGAAIGTMGVAKGTLGAEKGKLEAAKGTLGAAESAGFHKKLEMNSGEHKSTVDKTSGLEASGKKSADGHVSAKGTLGAAESAGFHKKLEMNSGEHKSTIDKTSGLEASGKKSADGHVSAKGTLGASAGGKMDLHKATIGKTAGYKSAAGTKKTADTGLEHAFDREYGANIDKSGRVDVEQGKHGKVMKEHGAKYEAAGASENSVGSAGGLLGEVLELEKKKIEIVKAGVEKTSDMATGAMEHVQGAHELGKKKIEKVAGLAKAGVKKSSEVTNDAMGHVQGSKGFEARVGGGAKLNFKAGKN